MDQFMLKDFRDKSFTFKLTNIFFFFFFLFSVSVNYGSFYCMILFVSRRYQPIFGYSEIRDKIKFYVCMYVCKIAEVCFSRFE